MFVVNYTNNWCSKLCRYPKRLCQYIPKSFCAQNVVCFCASFRKVKCFLVADLRLESESHLLERRSGELLRVAVVIPLSCKIVIYIAVECAYQDTHQQEVWVVWKFMVLEKCGLSWSNPHNIACNIQLPKFTFCRQ